MRGWTIMQPRPSPHPNPNQVSADERTEHNAASSEPKRRSRHADPMDDVPALVEAFVSSGHIVPLGVHVAEGHWVSGRRRVLVAESRLLDEEGEEVGRGTGTFMRSRIALSSLAGYSPISPEA